MFEHSIHKLKQIFKQHLSNSFLYLPSYSSSFTQIHHPDMSYKVKRTRSNLSWLRKSMRKLNPFQMPQINSENQPQTAPIASTSETSPRGDCRSDKDMLSGHDSFHELQARNDETVTSPCSSNPDLFNIVLTEQQQNSDLSRPRQYGRRSNPVRISSFQIDATDSSAVRRNLKI